MAPLLWWRCSHFSSRAEEEVAWEAVKSKGRREEKKIVPPLSSQRPLSTAAILGKKRLREREGDGRTEEGRK